MERKGGVLGGRRWVEDWGGVRLGLAMGSCGEEAWRFGREEVVSDEVGIGGGVESGW